MPELIDDVAEDLEVVVLPERKEIDLQAPTEKQVTTPTPKEQSTILTQDIVCAFFYQQKKHNSTGWKVHPLSTFSATSRKVERVFSITKLFLDRNKDTRIEVINALICLHDFTQQELLDMWKTHRDHLTSQAAGKAIKANPTVREGDAVHWQKPLAKAMDGDKAIERKEK